MTMNTFAGIAVESRKESKRVVRRMRKARQPDSMAAEMALRAGHSAFAIRLAGEVLEADGSNIGALETLAKAQWQENQFNELLGTLTRLIRLNPYEPGYHALKGATLQCLGRYGDSIRSYLRGGDNPGARESAEELRAWQADLVETLLREDRVFKVHYMRNPREACRARGFEFLSESNVRQWFLDNDSARSMLFTRPS
jgi:hypothetical protein